jgi:hypothetical protein
MVNTFRSRLTRTTPRWIVMPVLGAAAGAALFSLAVSAGTLPAAFVSATSPASGCSQAAGLPCSGTQPTVKGTLIQAPKFAPLGAYMKNLPVRQAISPMTPAEQAHKAAIEARLALVFPVSPAVAPAPNPGH